jgi:hypothetical protein
MTPQDFMIALFYAVDQERLEVPKHPDATLYPSEVVTLALLQAIKGGGTRAFYRWLTHADRPWCPHGPERTRLARLCKTPPRGPPGFWRPPPCWGRQTPTGSS